MDGLSPRRKKLIVACLAVNNVVLWICLSILIPIFPLEVKKLFPDRSAHSGLAVGSVFSAATIADFLFSPIAGKQAPLIGARRMLFMGTALVSSVIVLFAFVSRMYEWPLFLTFCYLLRITQGVGTAMVYGSAFSLLATTYPENVEMMAGVLSFFSGFGFLIGPSVGGVLYEYGGVLVPYLAMGCVLAVITAVVFFIVPAAEEVKKEQRLPFPQIQIVLRPRAFFALFISFYSMCSLGFFDSTYAVYLSMKFHLKPAAIGGVFIVGPCLYTIMCLLCGYLAGRYSHRAIMLAGLAIATLGFELTAPQTLFSFEPSIYTSICGCLLVGIGIGSAYGSASAEVLDVVRKAGFLDSPELHSSIGGLMGAMSALGITVGPFLGGFVSPSFSFTDGIALLGAGHAILFMLLLLTTLRDTHRSKTKKNIEDEVALMSVVNDTSPLMPSTKTDKR